MKKLKTITIDWIKEKDLVMLHGVGMKRLLVSRIHEPSEESSFSTEKTNFRFLLSVMAIFDQLEVEMVVFD